MAQCVYFPRFKPAQASLHSHEDLDALSARSAANLCIDQPKIPQRNPFLPDEIILGIFEELLPQRDLDAINFFKTSSYNKDLSTLKNLRFVCKSFERVVLSVLFKHVTHRTVGLMQKTEYGKRNIMGNNARVMTFRCNKAHPYVTHRDGTMRPGPCVHLQAIFRDPFVLSRMKVPKVHTMYVDTVCQNERNSGRRQNQIEVWKRDRHGAIRSHQIAALKCSSADWIFANNPAQYDQLQALEVSMAGTPDHRRLARLFHSRELEQLESLVVRGRTRYEPSWDVFTVSVPTSGFHVLRKLTLIGFGARATQMKKLVQSRQSTLESLTLHCGHLDRGYWADVFNVMAEMPKLRQMSISDLGYRLKNSLYYSKDEYKALNDNDSQWLALTNLDTPRFADFEALCLLARSARLRFGGPSFWTLSEQGKLLAGCEEMDKVRSVTADAKVKGKLMRKSLHHGQDDKYWRSDFLCVLS